MRRSWKGLALCAILAASMIGAAGEQTSEARRVSAGGLSLQVPRAWRPVRVPPRSKLGPIAQFEVPDVGGGGGESAEFAVFHYGSPTGGVDANLERWIGQFLEPDRVVKLTRGRSPLGEYYLADITGTWKKPDGPPMAQKTIDKPGSRMLGIVLLAGKSALPDYYFLRLSGPAAVVESQATAVRACLGADPAEEQPYELGQYQAEKEEKVVRTEREWRELLTPDEFDVLRRKGTERAFVNKYHDYFQAGTYACAACGQELFSSDTKFHSGCGWPAFYAAQAGDRVKLSPDLTHGMVRTEVTCARCDSHLGHIFDDAPQTPTGQRYCINSVALKFIPRAPAAAREPPK